MNLLCILLASSLTTNAFSTPTHSELCDCYKLNSISMPQIINDEICYHYLIHQDSDEDYCDLITALTLNSSNECDLTPADIDNLLLTYDPQCYNIDPLHEDGIKLTLAASGQDYVIFSMCFDPAQVVAFDPNGQISYTTTNGSSYTCDTPYLPNFCGGHPHTTTTTARPTPEPTLAPTYAICNSTDAYNIAFLLDESGSVSVDEWEVIINFVKRVIAFDVQDDSYVALYEFASLKGFERFLNFTGPKSTEYAAMEYALDNNRYTISGLTETWDAVNRVLDDFYTLTTNPYNQGRGNILFIITDRNPTDLQGNPRSDQYISDDYNTCPYIQDRLEQQFPDNYIDIVVIIVDPESEIDTSKIDCLDYYNNYTDIIPIHSFDSNAFHAIEERLRDKVCTDELIIGNQTGPGTPEWKYPDGNTTLPPVPIDNGGGVSCSNDPGAATCNPTTTNRTNETSPEPTAEPTLETTSEPTTGNPTTSNPTTSEPTGVPTTDNPTTVSPTTSEPTTSDPTTSAPTTSEPTTADPTSTAPTTSNPTTASPTTLQPTASPTFNKCNSTDPYNIAFLLDESGSVGSDEWDIITNFVKRLIDFDIQDDSYVALYEFASLVGFEVFVPFTGPKSAVQAMMEEALDNNRYSVAGQTETWDAVNRVLDDFYTLTTNPAHQARGNILFIITDGNPTDQAGNPNGASFISEQYNTCPYIQDRLEQQFPNNYIDIVLIVIDLDQSIDVSKIECLDYYNEQTDIIPIESFDSNAFHRIEARIREKTCTDGLVAAEGAGPGTDPWVYPDENIGLGPVPIADGGGVSCSNDPGAANPCTSTTSASS